MEGHELLAKMTKVGAPGGFEADVLARLPAARAERLAAARRARLRYGFAGSAALALVGFLLFSPSTTGPEKQDAVLSFAEREALTATPGKGGRGTDPRRIVPVYERMNYASELRNAQSQPKTVYLLEQVSEVPSSEIIF
jgi:hypothetical protein